MPSSKKAPSPPAYRLKITLANIQPLIWRRIEVSSSIKLCCLHSAFQVVMGWTECHLHQFEKDGKVWADPQFDEFGESLLDDAKALLSDLLETEGDTMVYLYDFGDNWRHEVLLEKIVPVDQKLKVPMCIGGERRCPPEDVGGVPGYARFLEAIVDPTHNDHEELVNWVGGHFFDRFDVDEANRALGTMRWPVRHRR